MKETKILKTSTEGPFENHKWQYSLILPDLLADWDVWDDWERVRLQSMQQNLRMNDPQYKDDIIFDIGAEHGAISALIAKYMTSKIVLFEPVPGFWPNIKTIWEANNLETPLASFCGLVGSKSKGKLPRKYKGWPEAINSELVDKGAYQYLHNKSKDALVTTLDEWSFMTKIQPTAITIDVEGAELEVLKGAEKLLNKCKPITWVSIHPDLIKLDYAASEQEVIEYMTGLGFFFRLLGEDHEKHYVFWHKEGRQLA